MDAALGPDASAVVAALAGRRLRLSVVTCSYDTAHEPVADQVAGRVLALCEVFPAGGPVDVELVIADDSGAASFLPAVARGAAACPSLGVTCVPVPDVQPGRGSKGRALRLAIAHALAQGADVVAYVNLNLKVDARRVAPALVPLLLDQADVVVGSRSPRDGGMARGQGLAGKAKSRLWSRLARTALPELRGLFDPNAPLKVMRRAAAERLVEHARVDGVGFDAEWLALFVRGGFRVATLPIQWQQRAGSRPPWGLVPEMVRDLWRVRRG